MVDNLSFDIRAEVLIAELLEQAAIPRDKAILKAKGIHARPFSRDVLEVELFEDDRMRRDAIFFHVAREGLYDALPEGIFHTPKTQRNATEMVDEIKKQNQQREDARTFFLPIEEEFNRQRILVEQEERKTIGGFSDYKRFDRHFQQGLIVSFWKLTKELSLIHI